MSNLLTQETKINLSFETVIMRMPLNRIKDNKKSRLCFSSANVLANISNFSPPANNIRLSTYLYFWQTKFNTAKEATKMLIKH